jgi:hypothetical protein
MNDDFDSFLQSHGNTETTHVTPIKWRADDGVVYERTGEKRVVQFHELHWCDGISGRPVAMANSAMAIVPHICPIWRISEDQDWQPPVIQPGPRDPLDRLLQDTEAGLSDDLGKNHVLAALYQARALRDIDGAMHSAIVQLETLSTQIVTRAQSSRGRLPWWWVWVAFAIGAAIPFLPHLRMP